MSRQKRKQQFDFAQKVARILVVLFCLGGFSYQAMEFLSLYWTYPTVVDIQETSPSYLDMPTFTICNPLGYNYSDFCKSKGACLKSGTFLFVRYFFCEQFENTCKNNDVATGFQGIFFNKFMKNFTTLGAEEHESLKKRLEDYMECEIQFGASIKSCNLENVMGSFYTKDDLPQYCYTIYSLWGQPNKKRAKIARGAIMRFRFNLNASEREQEAVNIKDWGPSHSIPTSPYVQIAVHSPYFLSSPYLDGDSYHGGKSYEIRVSMSDKHLLPLPYQTNCTDYLQLWKANGGKGPIDQLGVIQKCRADKYYEALKCVPLTIDYPHTYRVCGPKITENASGIVDEHECTLLADEYNQPCDAMSYTTTKKENDIVVTKYITADSLEDIPVEVRSTISGHNCTGFQVWRPECSAIDIEILFDRFEITNITYNAKYESLELFSVIGGYMGMWLGISLVTIYDFIGSALSYVNRWDTRRRRRRKMEKPQRKKTIKTHREALDYAHTEELHLRRRY